MHPFNGQNAHHCRETQRRAHLARVVGKFKHEKDFYENDRYVISLAVGHVVEMVPPEGAEVKRGKWKLENLPVLPDHFDLVPKEKTRDRLYLLKKLAEPPDVTEIINACDAGREGELIFRNTMRWDLVERSQPAGFGCNQ